MEPRTHIFGLQSPFRETRDTEGRFLFRSFEFEAIPK
jgi:hypothetical protein